MKLNQRGIGLSGGLILVVTLTFVVFTFLYVWNLVSSKHNQISKSVKQSGQHKESEDVKAAYKETADKAAELIISELKGTFIYFNHDQTVEKSGTNTISKLYCSWADDTGSIISDIVDGLAKKDLGTWTSAGPQYNGAEKTPYVATLQETLERDGSVGLLYETFHNDTLSTSNPNYYAGAYANIVVSNYQQVNECVDIFKQNIDLASGSFNKEDKLIISLELTLHDREVEF